MNDGDVIGQCLTGLYQYGPPNNNVRFRGVIAQSEDRVPELRFIVKVVGECPGYFLLCQVTVGFLMGLQFRRFPQNGPHC